MGTVHDTMTLAPTTAPPTQPQRRKLPARSNYRGRGAYSGQVQQAREDRAAELQVRLKEIELHNRQLDLAERASRPLQQVEPARFGGMVSHNAACAT